MSLTHYPDPPSAIVPCLVNFEYLDYDIVRQVASNRGLGAKGFSAALRLIIREWSAIRRAYPELLVELKPEASKSDPIENPDPDQFLHPPFP